MRFEVQSTQEDSAVADLRPKVLEDDLGLLVDSIRSQGSRIVIQATLSGLEAQSVDALLSLLGELLLQIAHGR